MNRKAIGDLGETAVCRYLEQRGYTIRDRNFRIRAWYIRYDIAAAEYWQGEIISIDYLENAFDESDFSL